LEKAEQAGFMADGIITAGALSAQSGLDKGTVPRRNPPIGIFFKLENQRLFRWPSPLPS
jgi:hypothetical protein